MNVNSDSWSGSGTGSGRGDSAPAPTILTLTLSPAWDLTISAEDLELGTSHRVPPAVGRLGGKGINVARVLGELGRGAYVQGPVAAAHWPHDTVAGAEADSNHGTRSPEASQPGPVWDLTPTPSRLRCSYALIEESGRATVLNERAAIHPAEVWAELEASVRDHLAEPQLRVLVISGSTPADLPAGFCDRLITTAHACGVRVIVDTSGPALLAAARSGADWVKPNDEELAELAIAGGSSRLTSEGNSTPTSAGEDLIAGSKALIDAGARAVLISSGADGMTLVDGSGERLSARLSPSLQGNPTGAGDAAVAALARWLSDETTAPAPLTDLEACEVLIGADGHPVVTDVEAREVLTDAEVLEVLTDAVAISASAVLMPQAGQIHPSWSEMRDSVELRGPSAAGTEQSTASEDGPRRMTP